MPAGARRTRRPGGVGRRATGRPGAGSGPSASSNESTTGSFCTTRIVIRFLNKSQPQGPNVTTREVWHPRPRPARGSVTSPRWTGCAGWPSSPCSLFHGGHLRGGYLGVDAVLRAVRVPDHVAAARRSARHRAGSRWARSGRRRARRLLPARSRASSARWRSMPRWIAQPDGAGRRSAGDTLATLGYVANWRAIFTHNDYWAMFRSPSPLEHTWSLAIEEQFYLLLAARGRGAPAAAATRSGAPAVSSSRHWRSRRSRSSSCRCPTTRATPRPPTTAPSRAWVRSCWARHLRRGSRARPPPPDAPPMKPARDAACSRSARSPRSSGSRSRGPVSTAGRPRSTEVDCCCPRSRRPS